MIKLAKKQFKNKLQRNCLEKAFRIWIQLIRQPIAADIMHIISVVGQYSLVIDVEPDPQDCKDAPCKRIEIDSISCGLPLPSRRQSGVSQITLVPVCGEGVVEQMLDHKDEFQGHRICKQIAKVISGQQPSRA